MVNSKLNRKKLEEWEEICPTCGGSGKVRIVDVTGSPAHFPLPCDRCNNTGKISWIDNILKKKRTNIENIIYAFKELNKEINKYEKDKKPKKRNLSRMQR